MNRVPLYCGEFGVFPATSKPEHRSNWFRDFGQALAENRIGWAVWGWDEGFGLNRKNRFWYFANTPSRATPDGDGQEQTIRQIWAVDP